MLKVCEYCNKEFNAERKNQRFCKNKHYSLCLNCNTKFEVKDVRRPSKTCSQSCASALTHKGPAKVNRVKKSRERYGVDHPFQSEEIKRKIKSSLDNSDKDFRFGSKRYIEWLNEEYNVDNVSQVKHIREKAEQTLMKNYNVKNPMKSKEITKNLEEKFENKHGFSNKSYIGVKNVKEYSNLTEFISNNPEVTVSEMTEYFGVKRDKMLREIRAQNVSHMIINYGEINSLAEEDFRRFIKDKVPKENVIINDRKLLKGKELDFYFPSHNLAIELSPSRTHNSIAGFNNSPGVEKNYHLNKFLSCAEQGIELITVFDWHDLDKVKRMILNKLNKSKRVFARNTIYKEENYISKDLFKKLEGWHILSLPSNYKRKNKVSILEYNDEIVGIALWNTDKKKEVELKRLVFKPGLSIVGGASKLVKNFMRENNIKEIYTFSDCDLGQGKVYSEIGFTLVEESRPQLNYYHPYYKKHIRHLSLVMQGADRLLSNLPNYKAVGKGEGLPRNEEIVAEYGFLPVYDCGYRKWRLKL